MSYLDLFQRYGRPSREAEIRQLGALTTEKEQRPGAIRAADFYVVFSMLHSIFTV